MHGHTWYCVTNSAYGKRHGYPHVRILVVAMTPGGGVAVISKGGCRAGLAGANAKEGDEKYTGVSQL